VTLPLQQSLQGRSMAFRGWRFLGAGPAGPGPRGLGRGGPGFAEALQSTRIATGSNHTKKSPFEYHGRKRGGPAQGQRLFAAGSEPAAGGASRAHLHQTRSSTTPGSGPTTASGLERSARLPRGGLQANRWKNGKRGWQARMQGEGSQFGKCSSITDGIDPEGTTV